ncbi:MAG: hypothetical protein ACLPY1_00860 [Terracidiphilus sp.]
MAPISLVSKPSRVPKDSRVPQVSNLRCRIIARATHLAGPAIILLAAAIASFPIWFHGPVAGDDFEFHLVSWLNAQQNWLHGVPYPHWATSPNFGAGEPRFVFYPPLTWMLGAALGLVLRWTFVPVAMTFLLLAATGLAVRAFARQLLPDAPATLAGCAAIFSGYVLFTTYYRTAFGELAGGFWIPLLLLFALRDRNPTAPLWGRAFDGSALLLTLAVTGVWLSDAPVGVMASYLLAGVALAAALLARTWFPIVRASISFALGVALSGLYLIPAAWEQRWVAITQATGINGDPGLSIENNWIFPHHADPALNARDQALHFISLVAVSMIAVALVSLLALWLRGALSTGKRGDASLAPVRAGNRRTLASQWWIPLALIPPVVLFLLLPVSLPVWNLLPKLRFLQFPWRWLMVVEAPMAIFFAAAVWPGGSRKRWLRPTVACLCALFFMAATVFAAENFFRDDVEYDDLQIVLAKYNSGAGFVGTDEYAPPGADNSIVATGLPDACIADDFDTELGIAPNPEDNPAWLPHQGSCLATATASLRQPEHLHVAIAAPRSGFLILRLRRYPAWRVTVNGHAATGLPVRMDGLIAIPVGQGPVDVQADWTTTADVIAGRCVSMVGLLLLVCLGLLEHRFYRMRRS